MRRFWLACFFVVSTQTCWSQIGKGGMPVVPRRENVTKSSEQAAKVLEKAKADAIADSQRREAEKASDRGQLDKLVEKARQTQTTLSAESASVPKEENSKLQQALAGVTHEGKALIAQSVAAPVMSAPDPASVVKTSAIKQTAAATGSVPQPQPLQPTPLNPVVKKEPERTVITSQGEAFFDSRQSMGVFTDDVVVVHPQFHMTGDVLEIYMNKEEKKDAPPAKAGAEPTSAPKPEATGNPAGDSNIRQAIAKGRKVVIQKLSETGEMQIGICRHATYIGATGEIVMRDYPQVQRGKSVIIGTSPTTVITIKPNGELLTQGPTKTDIIQEADKNAHHQAAPAQTPKPQGAQ